jgi:hypothetical protein
VDISARGTVSVTVSFDPTNRADLRQVARLVESLLPASAAPNRVMTADEFWAHLSPTLGYNQRRLLENAAHLANRGESFTFQFLGDILGTSTPTVLAYNRNLGRTVRRANLALGTNFRMIYWEKRFLAYRLDLELAEAILGVSRPERR